MRFYLVFVFVCLCFSNLRSKFHLFDSYTVHIRNKWGKEEVVRLSSENDVFRVEEEHGRENVRRSYLETPEYQEFLRRAAQPNEHDSGLTLERWDYETVHEILQDLSDTYDHCNLGVVGKSSGTEDIYFMRIGTEDENYDDKPEFKLVANIHGDEIVGLVLAVQFAHYLCTYYPSDDQVKEMIDNMNVYVVPTMNPYGYVHSRRGNRNNIDLNRNFYDQFKGDPSVSTQTETQLMMDFSEDKNFVLGIHFHGGAQVVSYPWDGTSDGKNQRHVYSASPDDTLFRYMSTEYADLNPMFGDTEFPKGITNGAYWYTLYGGIQDWEYLNREINTVTIELSNQKEPSNSHLNEYWNANFDAMMKYSSFTYKLGVRGTVMNTSGHPIVGAEFHVEGNDHIVTTSENGKFTRLLAPGEKYRVRVKMPWEDETDDQQWVDVDLSEGGEGGQVEISFVLSNVTSVVDPRGDDDELGDDDDDDESEGKFWKYHKWIFTAIEMTFCCCCCYFGAIPLYCCFFLGCFIAFSRGRKKGSERYFGMTNEGVIEEGSEAGTDDHEEEEDEEEEEEEEEEEGPGVQTPVINDTQVGENLKTDVDDEGEV